MLHQIPVLAPGQQALGLTETGSRVGRPISGRMLHPPESDSWDHEVAVEQAETVRPALVFAVCRTKRLRTIDPY
jgi:hypothetical protein